MGLSNYGECRNLLKKPCFFIRVPYMNPTILGVLGPGFLNQVPTLDHGLSSAERGGSTKRSVAT